LTFTIIVIFFNCNYSYQICFVTFIQAKAPPKGVNLSNLWGPHVWKESTRVKAIGTGCTANHSALVDEAGKVYVFGRNDSGQVK